MNNYCYNPCEHCNNHKDSFSDGMFYSIFLGLNDKSTKCQYIPTAQAMAFIEKICQDNFKNGFTILEGCGANRGNSSSVETSFYIMAINATKCDVFEVASILQKEFNNSEILIEENTTKYLYFNSNV